MNKCVLVFLQLFFSSFISFAQITETDTVYSSNVKDKFIITIRKPAGFNAAKKYHHVYMTDGTIGIGDYVLGKSSSWAATIPSNCIIIAIGHIGDWHDKRPRDLIPSDVSKNVEENFGKADKFYLFLKNELIPRIEKKIPVKKDRVFIGHSFGGLFCLYTLFRDDRLFDKHFAISPSCWANYNELDKIEEQFFKTHTSLNAQVTIYVGGLEFLNKVLPSTRSFYNTVTARKYKGLSIKKDEIGNANHFSIRKPAVDRIFEKLKD
ncbi:MAG TPA: alpha/beta hydrolase-fold protein [Chitinophagaceae bacterium]|nr:alpha/beta hydrolase-fold protein [Chitinophagaceae bacterium]